MLLGTMQSGAFVNDGNNMIKKTPMFDYSAVELMLIILTMCDPGPQNQ